MRLPLQWEVESLLIGVSGNRDLLDRTRDNEIERDIKEPVRS